MSELIVDKHIKYFTLCLNILPAKYQDQDNNKLSLIYFCLQSLEMLNDLKFTDSERIEFSQFIYDSYYINNGFRSIMTSMGPKYDKPTISSTFFALANLISLRSPINRHVDRSEIMNFLKDCQIKHGDNKGSFTPTVDSENQPFGDTDLRICYMVMSIRELLNVDELSKEHDIDTKSLTDYIMSRLNDNGGFSCAKSSESHLGYTYCAIGCLKLLKVDFSSINWDNTINWIIHRQINYPDSLYDTKEVNHQDFGGFNGRENKSGDSCYSWWGLASLDLLNKLHLVNLENAAGFLLLNQDHRTGGIKKDFDGNADPYHSFLALSSLTLLKQVKFIGSDILADFDTTLCLTKESVNFYKSLKW